MALITNLLFTALACIILSACESNYKTHQLDLRERRLLRREKEFSSKEEDYRLLVKIRNHLIAKSDTVVSRQWPPDIKGTWKGKSVCAESNCTRYAVGDKRSYIWEFFSDSNGLYTSVSSSNNQLIRIYNARLDSTGIHLFYNTKTFTPRFTNLNVDLSQVNPNLLKGSQIISYDNICQARLSMSLSRGTDL